MATRYWAKLSCNGTGNVPGQFVEAGQAVSFQANFSHPIGGFSSVDCEICFREYGEAFGDWTCVNAGSLPIPPDCVCENLTSPAGLALQSSATCPPDQTPLGPYPSGLAGNCYACADCEYGEDWDPLPSTVCVGPFTQTLYSTTPGCPEKTQEATGTKTPAWSEWQPDASTKCTTETVDQTRYDQNACAADEAQTVSGTQVCDGRFVVPGTLAGECPGDATSCSLELSLAGNTATINCSAFGVSLDWNGSSWSVASAPCGPHDVRGGSFNPAAKTMSANIYDSGCECDWRVSAP